MSDNFYYKNNPLVKLSSNLSSNDSSTDTNFLINGIDVKNLYLTSNNKNISSITKTGVGGDGNDKYSISGSKNLANTTTTSSIVGMNSSVHAIAIDSNNNVYVGGSFTIISDNVSANCIAKWNGSTWTALGTGMNNNVNAIAIDSNNNVYAGGFFTTAGGVSAKYIAKWNGSSWSALGTGMNNNVTTIAIDSNNNVYYISTNNRGYPFIKCIYSFTNLSNCYFNSSNNNSLFYYNNT